MIKKVAGKIKNKLFPVVDDKVTAEVDFWKRTIDDYQDWYEGKVPELFGQAAPTAKQKVKGANLKDSAILTWFNLHQKPKYLADLDLKANSLSGLKVLDVGAGPMPSALGFTNIDLYCLDPLYARYLEVGYPLHVYDGARFVQGPSENIPVTDNFFDAVISVNAIDHVDDFKATSLEIKRVLKPGGKFAMHVHYHPYTEAEPWEITDDMFREHYGWVKGLKKTKESQSKMGGWTVSEDEKYVIWKNF